MNKGKLWIPVLTGLMIGQLFAESERPFGVANTVRFGYNDNLYYREKSEAEDTLFVTDIIDLSFRAALSDRTDLTVKSQLTFSDDDGGSEFYPSLYAIFGHGVSQRLRLQLSEYYLSRERSGTVEGSNKRYNYYENRVSGSADYILDPKNRMETSVGHSILRNEDDEKNGLLLDNTAVDGGVTWKHEILPQRTYSMLNLRQSRVSYDHLPPKDFSKTNTTANSSVTNVVVTDTAFLGNDAYYDDTSLSVGLTHTFNQEWQGSVEAGVTYHQPSFYGVRQTDIITTTTTNGTLPAVTNTASREADNAATFKPIIRAGLVYSPSPATRLTGDFSLIHEPSTSTGYGGQDTAELRFGFQHDLTAKLMAKATVRFANTEYDEEDDLAGTANETESSEERMDLEFRLTYKLNRINFLEAGIRHSQVDRDVGEDWEQNVVDVGWRVELN